MFKDNFVLAQEQPSDRIVECRKTLGTERDLSLNRFRLRVHENPHASLPLDRRLFLGPFDELYKKGCQEKSSASTGARDFFSTSSPPVPSLWRGRYSFS